MNSLSQYIAGVNGSTGKPNPIPKKGFPITCVPVTRNPNRPKIRNPFNRTKGSSNIKTIYDKVAELEATPSWKDTLHALKGKNVKFDPGLRPSCTWVKIKYITVDQDSQRELDPDWCVEIVNRGFDPRRISPLLAVRAPGQAPGKEVYETFDSQHTVTIIAALAKAGFWKGVDPKKWDEMEVLVYYVETADKSFGRMAFLDANGNNKKALEQYDYFKAFVFSFMIDGNTESTYKEAAGKYDILKKSNIVPVRKKDPANGKIGTVSHIDALMSTPIPALTFVVNMHDRYWPDHVLDSSEFGLYKGLYAGYMAKNTNIDSPEFKIFMDEFNSIIKEFFSDPKQLKSEAKAAHDRFSSAVFGVKKEPSKTLELSIILQIYMQLKGTHQILPEAFSFTHEIIDARTNTQVKVSILDYLDHVVKTDIKRFI